VKKIPITKKTAKICDYTLWTISIVFAFWLDWRAGVALLAFDAMRVFEDIQKSIDFHERLEKMMEDDRAKEEK
jgi:hypothetical protein